MANVTSKLYQIQGKTGDCKSQLALLTQLFVVIPSRRDLYLSPAFGGGGAGLSLLELCMVLKRPTPWLLFKIKLIQNDRLAVEIEMSPAVGLKRKCKFLGCEASRATTRRNLEGLRMKTVGPKGKRRVDHLKTILREKECSFISSFLFPSDAPFQPLGAK